MRSLANWVTWLSASWRQETPLKLHSRSLAEDGTPKIHPDFERWMGADAQRARTNRVMKRLRKWSPREYEVAYRVCLLGERVDGTTDWLNERAQRNCIPYPEHRPAGPHYIRKDTLGLLLAALTYAKQYW